VSKGARSWRVPHVTGVHDGRVHILKHWLIFCQCTFFEDERCGGVVVLELRLKRSCSRF